MSSHNHPTSTQDPDVPPASADATPPVVPATDEAIVRRTFPLFAIALVVAGVLPVGIGVGVALRPKPVTPPTPATSSGYKEDAVSNETDSVSWAWRNQQRADDLFRAGDFGLALQLYQSKECADPLQTIPGDVEVHTPSDQSKEDAEHLRPRAGHSLRIALSHEALGQFDQALAILGSLAEQPDLEHRDAALLAQGRVLLRHQDFTQARATLGQLLCQTQESAPGSVRETTEHARFLLAIACLLENDSLRASDQTRPVSPLHSSLWKNSDVLLLDRATATQSNLHVDQAESTDSETTVGAISKELVPQILAATSAEERRRFGKELAEELLAKHSAHKLAGHLRLALGEVAYQCGDLELAAARYREARGRSSNAFSTLAAYNQGLVQFQTRDYRPAIVALGQFIDGSPGHEFRPQALLLRGRALLELGEGEPAAFDLKRAADLPGRRDLRAWATVYLGMARLQNHQPAIAARDMFLRREHVQSETARAEMGLFVSLARMESLESEDARGRETIFLLRGLASVDPDAEWSGACGRLLIGRAYHQLRLDEAATKIYERALQSKVQEPYASEMKLAVADYALASGDHSRCMTLLTELQDNKKAPWANQAGLRIAKWEFSQGNREKCLTICRELLQSDDEHTSILRIMGQLHEQDGDYHLAAECFAGIKRPNALADAEQHQASH